MDVNAISKLCFVVEGKETVIPTAIMADGTESPVDLTFGALVKRVGKIPFEFRSNTNGELKRVGDIFFRSREGEEVAVVVNDGYGTRFANREATQPFMMAIDGQYD